MAALNQTVITLADRVRRMDKDGKVAPIVEMLSERQPILNHIHFTQGNLTTGHRFISRTGLPSVNWRKFNSGNSPSKSRTDDTTESCGMLFGRSEIDVDLAELEDDAGAFRASEDIAQIAAMNHEVAAGIFYHSTRTAPEKFMGLAPRLDVTSGNPASAQIIKHTSGASGTDSTSMWLVGWGPRTVYGIYPKGSTGGISTSNRGILDVEDAGGLKYAAYVTEFRWKLGLCVQDWRYLARICNIDTGSLSTTADDLVPAMIKAISQIYDPSFTGCTPAFYCNRLIWYTLWMQARNKVTDSTLEVGKSEGKPVMAVHGIPVYMVDGLHNAEGEVT